ncbi:DUF5808 domain-containing protein [Kaistella carnis]|uniref:DUF5808 domain-containing protein n=1 Tax=Kaistella carnis TaxID=1241979 RepID=A0A3G8XX31_9FLAO|nr:DUF5808 domain-containing protein [Kaistella carnis]AZI33271.1 hypothetical protein EIB73_08805 [Kaistella carnis]
MKTNSNIGDVNNPDHWILGLFYFNKNDQRSFPPKRFKYLGWTINFANPYSIFAYLILIGAMLAIFYVLRN